MSDSFEQADDADETHDELPTALAPIAIDAELLAEEQAEDDFDFDFDDDFAEEFADEWEPVVAAVELVEEVDEDGKISFVVEDPADLD